MDLNQKITNEEQLQAIRKSHLLGAVPYEVSLIRIKGKDHDLRHKVILEKLLYGSAYEDVILPNRAKMNKKNLSAKARFNIEEPLRVRISRGEIAHRKFTLEEIAESDFNGYKNLMLKALSKGINYIIRKLPDYYSKEDIIERLGITEEYAATQLTLKAKPKKRQKEESPPPENKIDEQLHQKEQLLIQAKKHLSKRQMQVISLSFNGATVNQISKQLNIAIKSVSNTRSSAITELETKLDLDKPTLRKIFMCSESPFYNIRQMAKKHPELFEEIRSTLEEDSKKLIDLIFEDEDNYAYEDLGKTFNTPKSLKFRVEKKITKHIEQHAEPQHELEALECCDL